ncbi:dienelactone hydrolase-like enzyme [Marinobacter lipolyticus SM19]|uniref:Dienelactone hydrolase-like enzyme n=1 Tax=Marinobacter lipolyticus SM19 TaxID=1318628 RepID=R8B363_9GAMM|nr:dienelactone hydrolase-like enzyme [Marinobacter lipolyticus SM19]
MKGDITVPLHGQECAAWLYRPESEGPHPLVVMAHGLGAVKEMRLEPFAQAFCDNGCVVLVFDYRNFGGSEGEPRQLLSIRQQLQDWKAAIEFSRHLPTVGSAKTVLWGTSLSGGMH